MQDKNKKKDIELYTYTIIKQVNEYDDVWTYTLRCADGQAPIHFISGQFCHVVAPHCELDRDFVRHMSMASLPNEDLLFSMDLSSNSSFKSAFRKAQVSDTVQLFKINGEFTVENLNKETELVFIAGGIGITPIVSILKDLRKKELQHIGSLIYVGKEYLYQKELESNAKYTAFIKRVDVSAEIEKLRKQHHKNKYYYVCGSASFVESLTKQLLSIGIHISHIRHDGQKKESRG